MGISDQFTKELATLKKAPLTFAVGFTVLAVLIAIGEYTFFFKEYLAQKDSAIGALEKQLNAVRNPPQTTPQQPTPSSLASPSMRMDKIEQKVGDGQAVAGVQGNVTVNKGSSPKGSKPK